MKEEEEEEKKQKVSGGLGVQVAECGEHSVHTLLGSFSVLVL